MRDVVAIAKAIAEGMRYLHTRCPPWLHRNLTASNVLVWAFDLCSTRSPASDAMQKFSSTGEVKLNVAMLSRRVDAEEMHFMEFIPELRDGKHYTEKSGTLQWFSSASTRD